MFPILFYINNGLTIYTYPLLILLGSMISSYYFSRIADQNKLTLDFLSDHFFLLTIVTFLFARLGGLIQNFSMLLENYWRFFYIFDGKYNFYTGIFGFIICFSIIAYFKKENVWKWMDTLALPFLLFFFFTAIGDFLAGNNYGMPSNLPWAVSFNIPEVRYTIPVHPVQIYEAILLLLLILFIQIIKRKNQYNGTIATYSLFGFFLIKTILHFLRGIPDVLVAGFSLSLFFSITFTTLSLIVLAIKIYPHMHFFTHEK